MDDFGVLVQTYGIRPQGKSAPMAASKAATQSRNYSSANLDPPFGTSKLVHNSNSGNGSLLDDQNDVFGFSFNNKPQNYPSGDVFDDVFQMPVKSSNVGGRGGIAGGRLDFDMEAMFKGSMSLNSRSSDVDDNVIWGFSGKVGTKGAVNGGDLLSSDAVDDFLGTLGTMGSGSGTGTGTGSRLGQNKGSKIDSDDLIPGFGSTSSRHDRAQASSTEKSSGLSSIEELEDFGLGKMKKTNGNLKAFKVKNPLKGTVKPKLVETNFIDIGIDIEGSFCGNSTHQGNLESVRQNIFEAEAPDLDSFFGAHYRKSKPVPEETTTNRKTEEIPDLFSGTPFSMKKKFSTANSETTMNRKTEEIPDLFSGTPFATKKKFPPANSHDDFSLLFGVAPMSTQFEEIEGENKERRKARFEHFQTTQARMAQALADLNDREFRAQQEQEERYRIAEAMEIKMKQWAAGKEGNLRALLSSLQQVLAPELGWKPVTLTDLITSSQVKIAYKKAALCVHPDKVQQKGASLQQKYVAEKVFDLLKEAWNKFNSEELR